MGDEEEEEEEYEEERTMLWGSEFEQLHAFGSITQVSRTGSLF